MADDDIDTMEAPTRRDYVKYGGAVVGGGLLAGCPQGEGSGTTPTDAPAAADSSSDTDGDSSYTATMAPVGTVEFETPPERVYTARPHHTDMALALGRGDGVVATARPELFDGIYNDLFAELDGLSVDWADLYNAWPTTKENLYELDSDVHIEDPAYVTKYMDGLETADVTEISENVAPFFGNSLSGQHDDPPGEYADRYQYYGLWEIFEKVSQVFPERERYEALAEMRADLVSRIESALPPEAERPRVARVLISFDGIDEGIWTYSMNGPGFIRAHTRPFGVEDAFPDMQIGSQIDLEALADADPDVVLRTASFSPGANWNTILEELENDPVASEITAVENGRVHPLAYRGAGPILNLYQLEMVAKQLFPERFGEWPTYDGESYPEIPEEEQLFDHQRIAAIVNGEI